jgi:hypothetical protein
MVDFMTNISMSLIVFVTLILFDIAAPVVLNIIGIDQKYYLNYIMWINVLGVLYLLLPKKVL